MQLTPARAFALGVATVLVVAGTFVAGIGVGTRNSPADPVPADALANRIECPGAPSFRASRAETDRATECEAARHVQDLLERSGATGANVQANLVDTGTLLGPGQVLDVVAEVRLPKGRRASWDAEGVRAMIARSVGTDVDRVMLVDEQLEPLVDPVPGPLAPTPRPNVGPGPTAAVAPTATPARGIPAIPAPAPRAAR